MTTLKLPRTRKSGTPVADVSYPEAYHYDYSRFKFLSLPDNSFLLIEDVSKRSDFKREQFWLHLPDAVVVGFLETVLAEELLLTSIEVRETYRGIGLGQSLIRLVEDYYNRPMYGTGHFTPKGKRSLSFLPIIPSRFGETDEIKISRDMNFVKDWCLLMSKHSTV